MDSLYRDRVTEGRSIEYLRGYRDALESAGDVTAFTFELRFTTDRAVAQIVRGKRPAGVSDVGYLMVRTLHGSKTYHLAPQAQERLVQLDGGDYGIDALLVRPYAFIEWSVDTTARRTIAGYPCLRATGSRSFNNHRGQLTLEEFEAWFTPELPLPYGPQGYDGLPGIILELTHRSAPTAMAMTYTAREVNLLPDASQIRLPAVDRTLPRRTQEELDEASKKLLPGRH